MSVTGLDPQHFTSKGQTGSVREKRGYANERAARRALESFRHGRGTVYQCRHCGCWHISSRGA